MSMSFALPLLVANEEAATHALPMPAWVYGAIALAVVVALLAFVWMFRNTAHAALHAQNARAAGDAHHGHAEARGDGAGRAGH